MRPRRIRRGKHNWSCSDFRSSMACFNEAPANSPGKDRYRRLDADTRGFRFNEAPANSPGKANMLSAGRSSSSRFNEAPANSPGKGGECGEAPGRHGGGFNEAPANSPGKGGGATDHRGPGAAGFNEAPANSPGKGADRHPADHRRRWQASMRPRRIRRGKPPRPRWMNRCRAVASMRPRRIRRGKRCQEVGPVPSERAG